MKKILMSAENPEGLKLEDLTIRLREEIQEKSNKISNDESPAAQTIRRNNSEIIRLLGEVEVIQTHSYEVLERLGPDEGPSGTPRIG